MAESGVNQGVKTLLLKDGQVLVLLKQNGQWDLPGGREEENESCFDCLRREIREESGLDNVEITNSFASWSFVKESGLRVYGTTWLCRFVSGEISVGPEHSNFAWIPINQLKDMEIYHKYGLDKFMANSNLVPGREENQ